MIMAGRDNSHAGRSRLLKAHISNHRQRAERELEMGDFKLSNLLLVTNFHPQGHIKRGTFNTSHNGNICVVLKKYHLFSICNFPLRDLMLKFLNSGWLVSLNCLAQTLLQPA